jgi:hypothetical protein
MRQSQRYNLIDRRRDRSIARYCSNINTDEQKSFSPSFSARTWLLGRESVIQTHSDQKIFNAIRVMPNILHVAISRCAEKISDECKL